MDLSPSGHPGFFVPNWTKEKPATRGQLRSIAKEAAFMLAAMTDPAVGIEEFDALPADVQDSFKELRGQLWRTGFMDPYILGGKHAGEFGIWGGLERKEAQYGAVESL